MKKKTKKIIIIIIALLLLPKMISIFTYVFNYFVEVRPSAAYLEQYNNFNIEKVKASYDFFVADGADDLMESDEYEYYRIYSNKHKGSIVVKIFPTENEAKEYFKEWGVKKTHKFLKENPNGNTEYMFDYDFVYYDLCFNKKYVARSGNVIVERGGPELIYDLPNLAKVVKQIAETQQ